MKGSDIGHDNGLIVFKLERERPAFSLSGNQLFYVKDKIIRMADLTTGTNQGICNVRKLGSQWVQPRTLSYNPAERAVVLTSVSHAVKPGQQLTHRHPKTANSSWYPCHRLLLRRPQMAKTLHRTARRGLASALSSLPGTDLLCSIRLARYVLAICALPSSIIADHAEHRDPRLVQQPDQIRQMPCADERDLLWRYRISDPRFDVFSGSFRHSATKGARRTQHSSCEIRRVEHRWQHGCPS